MAARYITEGTGANPPRAVEPEAQPVVTAKGTRDVIDQVPSEIGPAECVTMIAHDLKTPLAIIMLEMQLVGERLNADPAMQHSVDRITQNVAYIDRLIADLLDLASVDAGLLHQQLRVEPVDLCALLGESIERAVPSVDRGRVSLELRGHAIVRGDRNRLERVIANLVGNALKYSSAQVTIVLECVGGRARVAVTDRGLGLTPEQSRTAFFRYRREANAMRSRDGYGLGLYISQMIIDAHHGSIGVNSTVGQGSEFFFEIDTIT